MKCSRVRKSLVQCFGGNVRRVVWLTRKKTKKNCIRHMRSGGEGRGAQDDMTLKG